jgi:hypothetical protein
MLHLTLFYFKLHNVLSSNCFVHKFVFFFSFSFLNTFETQKKKYIIIKCSKIKKNAPFF